MRKTERLFLAIVIFALSLPGIHYLYGESHIPDLTLDEITSVIQQRTRLHAEIAVLKEELRQTDSHPKCSGCTMRTLQQFPEGAPEPRISDHWASPSGLAYTTVPVECLRGLAWDAEHLRNAQQQYDFMYFLHLMKTGGTSLRQTLGRHASRIKQDSRTMYSQYFRLGNPLSNATIARKIPRWNWGHLVTHGYHMRFPEWRNHTGFSFLSVRDPLQRAISVYQYFSMASRETSHADFFGLPPRTYNRLPSFFWAVDIFYFLGLPYPRSVDSPQRVLDLMERARFAIRNSLVLISERPLESVALLSAVLGEPTMKYGCGSLKMNQHTTEAPKHADAASTNINATFQHTDKPLGLNLTAREWGVAMAKSRFARVLYEYAVDIFELRLQQFGIRKLLYRACPPHVLEREGFGRIVELEHLDTSGDDLPFSEHQDALREAQLATEFEKGRRDSLKNP